MPRPRSQKERDQSARADGGRTEHPREVKAADERLDVALPEAGKHFARCGGVGQPWFVRDWRRIALIGTAFIGLFLVIRGVIEFTS